MSWLKKLFGAGHPPLEGRPRDGRGWRRLLPEEAAVIVDKGTETPFSGEYDAHFAAGTYSCRRCGAALYRSEDKFDARCGWPSFDDELPGAVRRVPDSDGLRTEIQCAACGAHLGHVFAGEQMTDKNVRHCVNSLSLAFTPTAPAPSVPAARAYFAGGCFWGVEHHFMKVPGVLATTVGYMGGTEERPSYEQVSSRSTGHAETLEVVYDPGLVSFETLAKLFFEIHDPTQVDRQGPDVGPQYRSAVFYTDEVQRAAAERLIRTLTDQGLEVATKLEPAAKFWPAEEHHQRYYEKRGGEPYCHVRVKRF
jgi:peptide methionine sulfoxide reductase msrA/msrB